MLATRREPCGQPRHRAQRAPKAARASSRRPPRRAGLGSVPEGRYPRSHRARARRDHDTHEGALIRAARSRPRSRRPVALRRTGHRRRGAAATEPRAAPVASAPEVNGVWWPPSSSTRVGRAIPVRWVRFLPPPPFTRSAGRTCGPHFWVLYVFTAGPETGPGQTASRSRAPVSADGWRSFDIARASI